jgi:hypothetical protein
MILNVDKFKRLVQKATVNFSIESLQLNLDEVGVKSNMISSASDVVAILRVANDVLPEVKGELQFNFNDPVQDLMPYLNLIDGETVIKVSEEKISLLTGKQSSNVFFCAPQIVSVFSHNEPKANFSVFHKTAVDQDFEKSFDKIKKIGGRFNKVYFGVEKGHFYIETSDKTNSFSNSFRVNLDQIKYNDMSMCFDYKNIVNLMSVIAGEEFSMEFFYVKEHKLGMLKASNEDNSESYYLMSKKE